MGNNITQMNEIPSQYVGISFANDDIYAVKVRAGYTDLEEAERHSKQLQDPIFKIHFREMILELSQIFLSFQNYCIF